MTDPVQTDAAPGTQAQRVASLFAAHRSALTALLAEIPEEQATFAPWEGAMDFVTLGDHLDASGRGMAGAMNGQAPSREVRRSASLQEVRARLQESGAQVRELLAGLSDADLAREVPAFGGRVMSLAALSDMLISHEAHHKGQLWMMARQIGVKPPFFIQL